MKIGVIAIQGNVAEHVSALERTLAERDENGEIITIKRSGLVPGCDAIVLPGGESTTLARLMQRGGIAAEIRHAIRSGVPILGTCAGLILLAKENLLGAMDIEVKRNAFGGQCDSFEASIDITGVGKAFPAVFIRAPAIVRCGSEASVLARFGEYVVAAQQDSMLALAFHPEIVSDTRVHHYFLEMIRF